MGHSVGRWKAETLVVDTIPITDPTVFAEPVPLNVQTLIESGDWATWGGPGVGLTLATAPR